MKSNRHNEHYWRRFNLANRNMSRLSLRFTCKGVRRFSKWLNEYVKWGNKLAR